MRCYTCNSVAKKECSKCHRMTCGLHCSTVFDEETRALTNLCGNCYSKERETTWEREKS